ncbi:hypothetical protein RRG08_026611 [Elysia crispata]|uniref:Uncharacterized protein n=1 Tax=Elysia crispata TaxID=231223 RepID=A0AAE1AYR1_9GAST|nr:hypothetical protein RRG08_026611 [Elysia crispata]
MYLYMYGDGVAPQGVSQLAPAPRPGLEFIGKARAGSGQLVAEYRGQPLVGTCSQGHWEGHVRTRPKQGRQGKVK